MNRKIGNANVVLSVPNHFTNYATDWAGIRLWKNQVYVKSVVLQNVFLDRIAFHFKGANGLGHLLHSFGRHQILVATHFLDWITLPLELRFQQSQIKTMNSFIESARHRRIDQSQEFMDGF